MDEEVYRVKEYPNKEKGFFFDEAKFSKFSFDLFNTPNSLIIRGFNIPYVAIICGLYLNIIYFYSLIKKKGIFSILVNIFINCAIIEIILVNFFKIKEIK